MPAWARSLRGSAPQPCPESGFPLLPEPVIQPADFFLQCSPFFIELPAFAFPRGFVLEHQGNGLPQFSHLFLQRLKLFLWVIFLCIFTVCING